MSLCDLCPLRHCSRSYPALELVLCVRVARAPQGGKHEALDARACWPLLVALSFSAPAFAQGGGASSTGTIQGRVADAQGAVLPGVTVTATSPR